WWTSEKDHRPSSYEVNLREIPQQAAQRANAFAPGASIGLFGYQSKEIVKFTWRPVTGRMACTSGSSGVTSAPPAGPPRGSQAKVAEWQTRRLQVPVAARS